MATIAKELVYSKGHKKVIRGRELQYVMPLEEYRAIAGQGPKNMNSPDYVLDYLNEAGGFLGTVTKIVTEDTPIHIIHNLEE